MKPAEGIHITVHTGAICVRRKVKRKEMKKNNQRKGFTLIELMIVVAIIGILAAIAIPNFIRYQLRSKTTEAKVILGGAKTSEES
jgi:type IV pilus assembly protein PilA